MFSCGDGSTWIKYAIDIALLVSACLTVLLMQKAEHDQQINRIDAKWVRSVRRLAFIAVAGAAFMTILTDVSLPALLFLFSSAGGLLLIDVIALQQRPPNQGRRHIFLTLRETPLRHFFMRRADGN